MEQKTNAMRRLDAAKIPYIAHSLGSDEPMSATELAHKLNKEEGRVFKTLVTEGKSGAHYVFVIPSNTELDLKKAARAAGEKSISMLLQKNLLPLTGYVISCISASQAALVVKNLPANAGDVRDVGLISGWGRSPGE